MGLNLRSFIGPKADNAPLSIKDARKLFGKVLSTVSSSGTQTIAADVAITGDTSFTGAVGTTGDLTFTEAVTSPATSSTYAIKGKSVVHTCTAAATNVIAIDIPVGAKILGASAIVSTDLVFGGGGASADLTWTTAGGTVAATLAAKNDKGSALFDDNAASPIVAGAVKTMTLTPNAGTIDVGGVLVVTAWYEELTDLTDIA